LMVLAALAGETGKRPQLAQPVDRHPVIVFDRRLAVLPHRCERDIVPTSMQLLRKRAALDLRATDMGRVVVGSEKYPHGWLASSLPPGG
jgi:hypothetical protein